MRRIPLVEWRAQAAAQLMDESLSQQGHGHLSQANMQVEGTGAFPTQVLVEAEELFDVPAVRKIASQGRHLGTSAGASEAFEVVVLGLLSGGLNVAIARRGQGSAAGVESFASNGKASVITPLAGLYPLVSIPIAILLLGERIGWRESLGITLALISAAALSCESRPAPSEISTLKPELPT